MSDSIGSRSAPCDAGGILQSRSRRGTTGESPGIGNPHSSCIGKVKAVTGALVAVVCKAGNYWCASSNGCSTSGSTTVGIGNRNGVSSRTQTPAGLS